MPVSFASPLKRFAKDLFGLTSSQVHGIEKEVYLDEWDQTPREIMQKIGTEVGRSIHPDVWARYLCRYILAEEKRDYNGGGLRVFVNTDTRFPNEVCVPKEMLDQPYFIRINRPGLAKTEYDSHPSETSLDDYEDWDYVINNDGTLDDLRTKCNQMVEEWIECTSSETQRLVHK